MTQEPTLQFVGNNIADDSTNSKTVVTNAIELTQQEYNALVQAGTVLPDVDYYIRDAAPIAIDAAHLPYTSNTSTKAKIDEIALDVSQLSASTLPYSSGVSTKAKIDEKADASSLSTVATSGSYTDLSNKPSVYEYMEAYTSDGRYYSKTLTHIAPTRFPIIILRNTQNTGDLSDRIVYGQVSNADNVNVMAFSSNKVTYNQNTKTITIDNDSSAWARPYICYPSGALA